jgi:hypothetical protein
MALRLQESLLLFSYAEDEYFFLCLRVEKTIPGLAQQIWNIDSGERVCAFDDQFIP